MPSHKRHKINSKVSNRGKGMFAPRAKGWSKQPSRKHK